MSKKNTVLFAASLIAAAGAITADHMTSEAPEARLAQDETSNPCAAAAPPPAPGERNYDDIASDYSGAGGTIAPAPTPAPAPSDSNPCSAGAL